MFAPELLILAFGGGVLGAAIGGLNAFVLTGLVTMFTVIMQVAGVGDGANAVFWAGDVNWGTFFAPVVSFMGGAAAVAYAKKVGKHEVGNDIATPMWGLDAPDALLVGGVTGVAGWVIFQLLNLLGVPSDNVALGIVLGSTVIRYVFGETGFTGKLPEGKKRFAPTAKPLTYILLAVGFLPWFYMTVKTGGATTMWGFGMTAFWLFYLVIGVNFPVAHQIVHPGMLAAAASGSIWWGLAFAIAGAFLNDFFANLFNNYADTHIDPPAGVIAVLTTASILGGDAMAAAGDVVGAIVAAVLAVVCYFVFSALAE